MFSALERNSWYSAAFFQASLLAASSFERGAASKLSEIFCLYELVVASFELALKGEVNLREWSFLSDML